jgi:hypothetical protein
VGTAEPAGTALLLLQSRHACDFLGGAASHREGPDLQLSYSAAASRSMLAHSGLAPAVSVLLLPHRDSNLERDFF